MLNEYKDIALLFKDQTETKETWHSTKINQLTLHLTSPKTDPFKKLSKKRKEFRAPLRASIAQLDIFCSDLNQPQAYQKIPFLAFQNPSNSLTKSPISIHKNQKKLSEKQLYYQETHQYSKIVKANQMTLKSLVKKKIDIFELFQETKNLSHGSNHDLKFLTQKDGKTNSLLEKEKEKFIHNLLTLAKFEIGRKNDINDDFLNVYTPIMNRKLSLASEDRGLNMKKTDFIKTSEYFGDPIKKSKYIEDICNLKTRRFSLNSKDYTENKINADFFIHNNNNSEVKRLSVVTDENSRAINQVKSSVVVLNHTGKPTKFFN